MGRSTYKRLFCLQLAIIMLVVELFAALYMLPLNKINAAELGHSDQLERRELWGQSKRWGLYSADPAASYTARCDARYSVVLAANCSAEYDAGYYVDLAASYPAGYDVDNVAEFANQKACKIATDRYSNSHSNEDASNNTDENSPSASTNTSTNANDTAATIDTAKPRSVLALFDGAEGWALVNLICVIVNGVIMLALILSPIIDECSTNSVRGVRKIRFMELRLMTVATTVLSLMMFLITQNMSLEMHIIDDSSILYVVIFLATAGISVGVKLLGKTRESTPEDPRYIA